MWQINVQHAFFQSQFWVYNRERKTCVFEIWNAAKCNYLSAKLNITHHQLKNMKTVIGINGSAKCSFELKHTFFNCIPVSWIFSEVIKINIIKFTKQHGYIHGNLQHQVDCIQQAFPLQWKCKKPTHLCVVLRNCFNNQSKPKGVCRTLPNIYDESFCKNS